MINGYNTLNTRNKVTFRLPLYTTSNWCWPGQTTSAPAGHSKLAKQGFNTPTSTRLHYDGLIMTSPNTNFIWFPLNSFTYYLTLFSKFFSSFPHGTCSLSVSWQYLALDEIYHPFWAAFPNNPTLWKRIVDAQTPSHRRDSHPLWYCVPTDLNRSCARKRFLNLQRVVVTTKL